MRSKRHLLGFSIGLAVLWPGQRGPIHSRAIITGLLPGSPVALAVTLSTTVAACNVYRPVHGGLILTDPTAVVRAFERRLSWPVAMFTAGMAHLRRVLGSPSQRESTSRRLCSESVHEAWQGSIDVTVSSCTRRNPCSRGYTSSLPAPN